MSNFNPQFAKIGDILVYNKTISQVALRWVLDSGRVDSVIIGAKNCKQIEENCSTLEWRLSKEDISKLSRIQ